MNTRDFTRHAARLSCLALLTAVSLLPVDGSAQEGGVFKIKNRSVFSGTQVARDPFWPIGWKKDGKGESTAGQPEISSEEFVVSSILLSPPALAVINGKEYGEGQFILIPGTDFKAQVAAIQDGSVIILYHGKTVTSGLRRNEHLSTPKPYDPSLSTSVQAAVTPR